VGSSRLSRISRSLSVFAFTAWLIASAWAADRGLGGPATAAVPTAQICDDAVLRNGFTIQFFRREITGLATRLWLCAGNDAGYVDIPSEQIEGFEPGPSEASAAPLAPTGGPEAPAGPTLPAKSPIESLIAAAAARHLIDPDFVSSVVKAESGFIPTAVSPKGALGLMQLMPRTAASLGVEDVLDPAANVEGGTKYLRQLLDLYDGDALKALAAYNAGPQRVEQYGGVPPFPETRAYITRIINDYNRKKHQQEAHSAAPPADR
jgi:Transglycosylase SLT domain